MEFSRLSDLSGRTFKNEVFKIEIILHQRTEEFDDQKSSN